MRYQSRAPLRPRSLNLPAGLTTIQQRANPTCSLSLANVSVGCSSGGGISTMDMELDTTPAVLVTVPQPDKMATGTVAFPKRPHSLLRGTTPSSGRIGSGRGVTGNENASAQELEEDVASSSQDSGAPPRKRTRTIALSTPRRTRRLTSPIAAIQRVYTPPILTALVPAVESEACSSVSVSPTCSPSSEISAPPAVTQRPFWYRRRYNTTDMKVLLYVYRTLVYGLEVRYAGSRGIIESPSDSQVGLITARSYLDVQDACLAHNLKDYLLRHGTNPLQLVVDLDAISQEGQSPSECTNLQADFDSMDVDGIDSSHSSNSKPSVPLPSSHSSITPFLHPHIHASTTHSILSYQQLIAAIHIRRQLLRNNVNRSQQNCTSGSSTSTSKPRKSSPLVQMTSLDCC